MTQVLVPLPPTRETQTEFKVPGFYLAQAQLFGRVPLPLSNSANQPVHLLCQGPNYLNHHHYHLWFVLVGTWNEESQADTEVWLATVELRYLIPCRLC